MEKCKTKLVPKLVDKQIKFTRKIGDDIIKKHLAVLEKEYKEEPYADLEKRIAKIKKSIKDRRKRKEPISTNRRKLAKNFTEAYCNPGCKGTLYQEGDLDIETFVKDKICKKDETRDAVFCKSMIDLMKKSRKRIVKDRKRILDDDSFYYAFINKTKKAKLRKDGALSGCAVTSLV